MEPRGNMVTIREEYYKYLVECSTRLKILQDIRIREAKSACQYGKPNVMIATSSWAGMSQIALMS